MTAEEWTEFYRHSLDSLHEAAFENTRNIAELTAQAKANEQRWEALRRALAGAIQGFLDDDDEAAE